MTAVPDGWRLLPMLVRRAAAATASHSVSGTLLRPLMGVVAAAIALGEPLGVREGLGADADPRRGISCDPTKGVIRPAGRDEGSCLARSGRSEPGPSRRQRCGWPSQDSLPVYRAVKGPGRASSIEQGGKRGRAHPRARLRRSEALVGDSWLRIPHCVELIADPTFMRAVGCPQLQTHIPGRTSSEQER